MRFHGIAATPVDEIRTLFRYVLPQTALVTVEPEILAIPTGERDGVPRNDLVADAIHLVERENATALVRLADDYLERLDRPRSWTASALRWLRRLLGRIPPHWQAVRYLLSSMANERTPNWYEFILKLTDTPSAPALPNPPLALPAPRTISAEDEAAFRHIVEAQRQLLDLPIESTSFPGRIHSICTALASCLQYLDQESHLTTLSEVQQSVLATQDCSALKNLLDQWLEITTSPQAEAPPVSTTPATERPTVPTPSSSSPSSVVANPPRSSPPTTRTPPEKPLSEPSAERTTSQSQSPAVANKTLKIDQHRVDVLMDLIGELVVAKNGLPYLAQRAERLYGSRELSREIKEQYGVINRIAQELQASIMQVRMMPVGQVFQRFPRLVRDLSKKLDKQIQLVILGEDTEADKNIIEGLADPLIHILRNSIDHGLEPPEERIAAGKPPTGTIRIRAFRDNDSVALEISDDGRGVNVGAVKAKAVRNGLLTPEQAETMRDDEAVQLIFAAGLSTAEQLSDVSGRGVGMDVVRSSLERVGGSVTVQSQAGVGTDIRLLLPLSMAVTQVMAVELDRKPMGVPMEAVVETVRLEPKRIFTLKQREAFLLREQLVPLIRLRRIFSLPEVPDNTLETLAVLVVKIGNESVGLVADDFREGMEVILKPLDGVLAGLRQYAGTALLGDGSVMLVLNLRELL